MDLEPESELELELNSEQKSQLKLHFFKVEAAVYRTPAFLIIVRTIQTVNLSIIMRTP